MRILALARQTFRGVGMRPVEHALLRLSDYRNRSFAQKWRLQSNFSRTEMHIVLTGAFRTSRLQRPDAQGLYPAMPLHSCRDATLRFCLFDIRCGRITELYLVILE